MSAALKIKDPDFTVHERENNPESEQHLKENHKKFSVQCLKVLELFRQGKRLTTMNAPGFGILSLPRRIKDLRDLHGVHIDEVWLVDDKGKQTVKEWFIDLKVEHKTKKSAAEFWNNYLKEIPNSRLTQTSLFDKNDGEGLE